MHKNQIDICIKKGRQRTANLSSRPIEKHVRETKSEALRQFIKPYMEHVASFFFDSNICMAFVDFCRLPKSIFLSRMTRRT